MMSCTAIFRCFRDVTVISILGLRFDSKYVRRGSSHMCAISRNIFQRIDSESYNKSISVKTRNGLQLVLNPVLNGRRLLSKGDYEFCKDTSPLLKERWKVVAYACARELQLEKTAAAVQKEGLYHSTEDLPEDVEDAVHFSATYELNSEPREVYIFRQGAVIFWNVPELERLSVLKFMKKFGDGPYDDDLVLEENEILDYSYTTTVSKLKKGTIFLNVDGQLTLEKYSYSNALALSVILAMWENSLERFVESIEDISKDLKRGNPVKLSRRQVLRKIGELFMLSHMMNLSSDLLDTPDFYWEWEDLEPLYQKMCHYLNISKRTKVMNEKINHCSELLHLLKDHLNDQHHVRLEIMIIALIMVEVVVEIIHWKM